MSSDQWKRTFDQKIVRLRVLACVLVVLVHITNAYLYSEDAAIVHMNTFPLIILINTVGRLGVPSFFMISGWLMLSRAFNFEKNKKKLIHYISILFIWSVIFLLWNACVLNEDVEWNPLFYLFEPAKNHFWYLYDLIGIYIAYPLIDILVHHMNRKTENYFLFFWLLLAGGGNLLTRLLAMGGVGVSLEYRVPILQGTYWLGYCVSGYILYKRRDELKKKVSNKLLTLSALLSILAIVTLTYVDTLHAEVFKDRFLTYGELFSMIAAVSVFILNSRIQAREYRIMKAFGKYTFGIYLIHPVFIDIAKIHFGFGGLHLTYILPILIVVVLASAVSTFIILKIPHINKIVT